MTEAPWHAIRKSLEVRSERAQARLERLRPYIEEARSEGCSSLRQIAAYLNTKGIQTAREKSWTAEEVRRVLARLPELNKSALIEASEHLLALMWDGPRPSESEFATALDRIALAYQEIAEVEPLQTNGSPPTEDLQSLYQRTADRFADFSLVEDTRWSDPVAEIANLTRHLREAVWRFETFGQIDAHSCLREQYADWGRSMRTLALFLHVKEFG